MLVFIISYMMPVDPARAWAGPKAREEQVEALRERYHLNDPLYMQVYYYLRDLLHGDLGVSATTHRPVLTDLGHFFPATFELAILAFILAVIIGVPLGVISALKRNRVIDHFSRVVALTGVSTPLFWSALLLQFFFYYKLGWLPAAGRCEVELHRITGFVLLDSLITQNMAAFVDALRRLILPSFTLAFYSMGYLVRITRGSMLEVIESEYIMTAKSKGLPRRVVTYRHALKNAIIPPLTVLGINFGWLLSGTVLLETIFAWPGMGRYAAGSIVQVDLPAIVGYTLVVALVMILSNFVVDILYSFIDPRIRMGGKPG
jgi:peptide/nickel transport system permease protein